jgi:hypothetical protein
MFQSPKLTLEAMTQPIFMALLQGIVCVNLGHTQGLKISDLENICSKQKVTATLCSNCRLDDGVEVVECSSGK